MYWPGNTSIIYTKEQKESYRTCICEETGVSFRAEMKSKKLKILHLGRREAGRSWGNFTINIVYFCIFLDILWV